MSLSTYTDLKSSIADYVQRSDLTAVIPDFITLCEAMMNNGDAGQDIEPLRVRQMEASTTGTTLAADFLEMIRLTYAGTDRVTLTYVSPADIDAMYPSAESGDPLHYTIIGSTITIRPTAASGIEQTYYQKIPSLSDAVPSNWLLAKVPQAYLYGTLFQEAIYNQNADAATGLLALYRNAILGLERGDRMAKAGQFVRRVAMPAW